MCVAPPCMAGEREGDAQTTWHTRMDARDECRQCHSVAVQVERTIRQRTAGRICRCSRLSVASSLVPPSSVDGGSGATSRSRVETDDWSEVASDDNR